MFPRCLLLLEFLLVACDFGTRADSDDKCDLEHAEDYALTARFTNHSCLFEVWGARKKVNARQKGSDTFVLDANLASAICQYHNATLPVIDSEDKENFLLSLLEAEGPCLLGLKEIGGKSVWENGQELTYTNEDWRHTESPCTYTLLVQLGSGAFWEDLPCDSVRPDHVLVFCEDSYDHKITPINPVTPPWDMSDKCDPMNEHKFRRVRKYDDGSCYFEVAGADEEANRPTNVMKNGISYFTFDVELAKQICNDYDATLPVLRSEEEEKWLLEFTDQNFNYVALGLHVTSDGQAWDDGTPITYANPDWRQKSQNGTSYTLLISSLADEGHHWIDTPPDELVPNGVQVICKESSRVAINGYSTKMVTRTEQINHSGSVQAAATRVSHGNSRGGSANKANGQTMITLLLPSMISVLVLLWCTLVLP